MPDAAVAILATLVVYKVALIAVGFIAQRRTRNEADYILGGRQLGPLVAAISASASSSSVWTLLGVSGYAYANGLSALWMLPACIGGFALNWFVIAPRLRRDSATTGALTLSEFLAGPEGTPGRAGVMRVAALLALCALSLYVASQLQGAGKLFDQAFAGFDPGREPAVSSDMTILLGAVIIVIYTLLGGFWAVSITDTIQGLMMAATAVILPVGVLVECGGLGPLVDGIHGVDTEGYASLVSGFGGASAVGFIAGILGIGLGYPGQPHVVNRFMALPDDRSVRAARRYAMVWAVLVYVGMILVGLGGRVLVAQIADGEEVFFVLTAHLFPAIVAGVMIAAVLAAVMSTADSQLLVAASAVSHDLGLPPAWRRRLSARVVMVALSVVATLAALYGDRKIFDQVLAAWTSLGAAFGPLLVVALFGRRLEGRAAICVMLTGFGTSILTRQIAWFDRGPDGKWMQEVLPYVAAGAVAWFGALRTRRDARS